MMNLKEIRLKRGFSQKELAARLECQQPNIVVMEKSPMPPGTTVQTLQKIALALRCGVVLNGTNIHFVEK